MANAKKVTRTEIVTVGVELALSMEEAQLLMDMVGYVVGGGCQRKLTDSIYAALGAAGIKCQGSPFSTTVILKEK